MDNLGGATFSDGEGKTQWVRLGMCTFRPTATGDVTFTLGYDLLPGTGNSSFAEVGAGNVDWNLIRFGGTPLTVHQQPDIVDVHLVPRIAKSTSDTSAALPASDRTPFWALEGDGTPAVNDFYVEIWVRSEQASPAAISGGSVNVEFRPAVRSGSGDRAWRCLYHVAAREHQQRHWRRQHWRRHVEQR